MGLNPYTSIKYPLTLLTQPCLFLLFMHAKYHYTQTYIHTYIIAAQLQRAFKSFYCCISLAIRLTWHG